MSKNDWTKKPNYQLKISTEADHDLERLYFDGFLQWGEAQADKYFDTLIDHFSVLSENPFLFRAVDEIRKGYRRSVCGKHAIFYKVVGNSIEIMAIVKHENRP